MPKSSVPGFDARLLENLSLGDFVEMARIGTPTTEDKELEGLRRLAEQPRFRDVTRPFFEYYDTILAAPRELGAMLSLFVELGVGIQGFLKSIAVFFDKLADRQSQTVAPVIGQSAGKREPRGSRLKRPPSSVAGRLVALSLPRIAPHIFKTDGGRLVQISHTLDPTLQLLDRLLELLEGVDTSRFRRCAFEKCRQVFYAKRVDQLCCSRRCNNNRLQREWYQKYGKSKVYERASRRENKR
jgi:hypothetical protein